MATQDQYIELSSLPEEVRLKVVDFIATLMEQWGKGHGKKKVHPPKKELPFGQFKGKIRISPDFDAPLDDFKDYM